MGASEAVRPGLAGLALSIGGRIPGCLSKAPGPPGPGRQFISGSSGPASSLR